MMLLQKDPPVPSLAQPVSCIISQGLHLLRDSPGTLETPRPGFLSVLAWWCLEWGFTPQEGISGRQQESALPGSARGHPDSKAPGDSGEMAVPGAHGEWNRAWVRRSELHYLPPSDPRSHLASL